MKAIVVTDQAAGTAGMTQTRRFPAGSVVLTEDTTGKGHSTKHIGDETIAFCVALPA